MSGDKFIQHFQNRYGDSPDNRIVLSPQSLSEATDYPRLKLGVQNTIIILYTGGTIGSQMTPDGYAPVPINSLEGFAALHPGLNAQYEELKRRYPDTNFVFKSITPLDSGAMNDADRLKVIKEISDLSQQYGTKILSFIVLHGTDSAVETACFMNNYFGDGSIPLIVTPSQYTPDKLGGDGPTNFLQAVSMSHCNISGTYIMADGTAFHPADCTKQSDSSTHIFGVNGYGFGDAGQTTDGGIKMRMPFTGRGFDALTLPFVPDRVIECARELDTQGRFMVVPNSLTSYDIQQLAKRASGEHRKLDAVFVEGRGMASTTNEANLVIEAAASNGIPTMVASVVPRSSGALHYAIAANLDKPNIFRIPGVTSTLDRRYAVMAAASYARYFVERMHMSSAARATDPLNPFSRENDSDPATRSSGPYVGNAVSTMYSLVVTALTRGHVKGTNFVSQCVTPQAGFLRLVRSLETATP